MNAGPWSVVDTTDPEHPFVCMCNRGEFPRPEIIDFCVENFSDPDEVFPEAGSVVGRRFRLMFTNSGIRASFRTEEDRVVFLIRWIETEESELCSNCEGGGWECYGIGHNDPHFRVCSRCGNPHGFPCP